MKQIIIYTTSIKVFDEATLAELLSIDGFEELLDRNIGAERLKAIADTFIDKGIEIHSVVIPDGFTDEWSVDKIHLGIIIKAVQNTVRSAHSIDDLHVRLKNLNEDDEDFVLRVLRAARKLGVEQDRMMDIFDEVLVHINIQGG